MSANFSDDERNLFARLADELIPAGDGMLSASQAGVAGKWLDCVLAARPDLAEPVRDLIERARERIGGTMASPAEFVADLEAGDAAAFAVLAEVVPAAYFMNPDVRQAIGYAGQGPRPIDPRADYMEDGLLESVIRRGAIYRPTPAEDISR